MYLSGQHEQEKIRRRTGQEDSNRRTWNFVYGASHGKYLVMLFSQIHIKFEMIKYKQFSFDWFVWLLNVFRREGRDFQRFRLDLCKNEKWKIEALPLLTFFYVLDSQKGTMITFYILICIQHLLEPNSWMKFHKPFLKCTYKGGAKWANSTERDAVT